MKLKMPWKGINLMKKIKMDDGSCYFEFNRKDLEVLLFDRLVMDDEDVLNKNIRHGIEYEPTGF